MSSIPMKEKYVEQRVLGEAIFEFWVPFCIDCSWRGRKYRASFEGHEWADQDCQMHNRECPHSRDPHA